MRFEITIASLEIAGYEVAFAGLSKRQHAIKFRSCRVVPVFVVADGRIGANEASLVDSSLHIDAGAAC